MLIWGPITYDIHKALTVRGFPAPFSVCPSEEQSYISPAFVYTHCTALAGHSQHPVSLLIQGQATYSALLSLQAWQFSNPTANIIPPVVILGCDWLSHYAGNHRGGDRDESLRFLDRSGVLIVQNVRFFQLSAPRAFTSPTPNVLSRPPTSSRANAFGMRNTPSNPSGAWVPYGSPASLNPSFGLYPVQSSSSAMSVVNKPPPSLARYLVPNIIGHCNIFSMSVEALHTELCAHDVNITSNSLADSRRVLLEHLFFGWCSANIIQKRAVFSPTACFQVSKEFDLPVHQSYIALSPVLSHYIESRDDVFKTLVVSLGLPNDLEPEEIRPRLNTERKELLSKATHVDVGVILTTLHSHNKTTLLSMAEAHGLSVECKTTKESIIEDLLDHLREGACSPQTIACFPMGCACASLIFDVEGGTLTPDQTEMTVAMLLLMSRKLKTRKLLEKLNKNLGLSSTRQVSFNNLRRSIRRYAVTLRKSKQVRLCAPTCTPDKKRERVVSQWPERLSEQEKEEFIVEHVTTM
ncbi:hypothetical protein PM082_024972 [Marasmius tenuissimus]|nr:hypothetical protein PM082_024972 [Marasmius tenuissimus]